MRRKTAPKRRRYVVWRLLLFFLKGSFFLDQRCLLSFSIFFIFCLVNGEKKYVLGEILEKILDKRYRKLDRLYSGCKRYEAILHYPEDMREANESEELFQGAITFYAKIEQMIANTPPYSAMDIQRDALRRILNRHSWAFEEDVLEDNDTKEHYHFYVRIATDKMEDAELLRDIYIIQKMSFSRLGHASFQYIRNISLFPNLEFLISRCITRISSYHIVCYNKGLLCKLLIHII